MERLTMRNSDGSVSQPTRTSVEAVFYRLADYEDAMPIERVQELAQAEKDGWPPATPRAKTYDAHTAEAEYLLGVLWNGLHNADGMDAKVADRVAEIAHESDKVQPATTPKNDPLNISELREMYDNEEGPVWVNAGAVFVPAILDIYDGVLVAVWNALGIDAALLERDYGKTWLAYRRKPEEGVV